jgi:hypothetical protein
MRFLVAQRAVKRATEEGILAQEK